MIRHILFLCLILLATSGIQSFGQRFTLGSFDKLPQNNQLFPRDKNNEAIINISGKLETAGFTHISVVRYRNEAKTGYQRINATYANGVAPFSFDTKIKSELAEYAFEVYAIKSATDSSLIVKRSDVVAGDFYIIYGQSNAVAWEVDYQYRNEFCRTFGNGPEGVGFGLTNSLTPRVGIFGIEFQKMVAEKYGIPTCVINGAVAGASLGDLTVRNSNNPTDGSNPYGAMLSYATQSGLLPYTRAIYYWQGENEAASDNPLSWAPRIPTLINQLQADYPSVEKIYVFQLPLFGGGPYDDRIGAFRESQRTLDRTLPIVQPYAALGAPGWNGFHYGLDGYLKIGQDMADMAGYFHYGKKEKMTSPSLQKAFYSNPQSSEITMVFEDYQEMVYPNDTLNENNPSSQEPFSIYSVKDFF
ncbi:MAG TPA: sialate O-acetylesterase, partial [Dyadobacter sp.]|nr:sialate O-acetylesterase [Dyadobacter sp.]